MALCWQLDAADPGSSARAGRLLARDGTELPTPLFQPVATAASLKTLDWRDLRRLGYRHVLANTYHLVVRPGLEALQRSGGMKGYSGWDGSLLTDSGGYQVFSLAHKRSIRDSGVSFTDHIEGTRWEFTPQFVLRAQLAIGSDFAMALDICTGQPAGRNRVARDMELTHRWAAEQAKIWPELIGAMVGQDSVPVQHSESQKLQSGQARSPVPPNLFGIVQGGLEEDLRGRSIDYISALPFDGVAVGGLAVGEAREDFLRLSAFCGPRLPAERVHYLMGVGEPADLLHSIAHGFDLFDCVQPTRMARHGVAYTRQGSLPLTQARFTDDDCPLDVRCRCYVCRTHSRAYLRHLFTLKEHSYARLLTLHNLRFYRDLLAGCRRRIVAGSYGSWWQRAYTRLDRTLPDGL